MTADALDVWLYNVKVARLRPAGVGRVDLEWTSEAEDRWGLGSRVVSNLLPIGGQPHPARTHAFLSGYLPEGRSRTSHAIEAGVEVDDTSGLIATYGRDLAGALIIVPEGESPQPSNARYVPIDLSEVALRLESAS